jgi:histidine phosphotransferase ChpT
MSAGQALARLQFLRIAFGAAGSAGAELDLTEVGRLVQGLLAGSKVQVDWQAPHMNWPKDWAKLLMNATMLGAECLPRGGDVRVETSAIGASPSFKILATGLNARVLDDVEKAARGDSVNGALDARSIQPYLAFKLARAVSTNLALAPRDGGVEISAG